MPDSQLTMPKSTERLVYLKKNYSGTIYSFGGRDRGNTQYYFNAYNYFMMQFAYNTHTVIIYTAIGERKHVHVSR